LWHSLGHAEVIGNGVNAVVVPAWSRIEDGYLKLWSASAWQMNSRPRQLLFCGEYKISS
jgi:hypothetical protein